MASTPLGGVKGRVLSKTDRYPVEHARVRLLHGAEWVMEVRADANGNFRMEEIPAGEYTLVFLASGYLENRLPVVVTEGKQKNVFNILLSEINRSGDSWLDAPYGATDIHRNVKNYLGSGNDSDLGTAHLMDAEILLAGVRMDQVDPTASSFLSEALRENKFNAGGEPLETALGGYNGVAEIAATASLFRSGFYGSLWNDTAKYGLRADAAYGSGKLPGGWSLAANVAGIGWNKTAYDPYAVYVGVGKAFGEKHQLSAAFLRDQEPMAFFRYDFNPSQKFQAYTTVLGRFGLSSPALHAAAAFSWKPSRLVRLSGGVDGRKGLQDMTSENRAEGWLSGMLTVGKWGFHLGGRGGYYTSSQGRGAIYTAKAGLLYALSYNWQLSANTGLYRYNPLMPDTFATDVNVALNTNSINMKLTGFYERYIGTDDIHAGLEFGFKVPVFVIPNLSLQGQVTAGHFGAGDRFECTFAYGGLSWNAKGWFADAGYKFDKPLHMIDTSAGKTWTFDKKRQLGVALGFRPYFGDGAPAPRFSARIFCRI